MSQASHCLTPVQRLALESTDGQDAALTSCFFRAGKCQAPQAGWEDLCDDLKLIVLRKLSLRDLARAAPISRKLWPLIEEAWLSRAAEERARLIALGKERYKDLFGSFVIGLQRVMCGLPRCPDLRIEPISFVGGVCLRPHASLWSGQCEMSNYDILSAGVLFYGGLHRKPLADGEQRRTHIWFTLKDSGEGNVHLNISVHLSISDPGPDVIKEAAGEALGILLAFRTEIPEALMDGSRKSLTTVLRVRGWPDGPQGMREEQDLVAPLRCLAESITIDFNMMMDPPTVAGEVQKGPLGILDVRATREACNKGPHIH
jgi:hypothetical protein